MVFSKLFSFMLREGQSNEKGNANYRNQVNCDFILPRLPDNASTIDEQIDWITQCELTLGTSLGVQNVFVALAPEIVGLNYTLFKKIVDACDKISDCSGKESYKSIVSIILDGIPDTTRRAIMGYLFEFYLESQKLTFSSKRLCNWFLSRRIGNNAPQAQLGLVLNFSFNQYQDAHS